MKVFHRTPAADAIRSDGFRDGEGTYGTAQLFRGVWLSDEPLDIGQGASGDTLLTLEIPESSLRKYEWVEDEKTYREFLVPAEIVNRFGPPEICEDE